MRSMVKRTWADDMEHSKQPRTRRASVAPLRARPATVTSIFDYGNRELIETLVDLLQMARNGEVVGLIFAAQLHSRKDLLGAAGSYLDDMTTALGASARLMHLANRKISAQQDD